MAYREQMTFEYLMERMLERVPDSTDKREGSVIYDALAPAAAELAKLYIGLDVIMDETFVDTASLQYLRLRCKERNVPIKEATKAIIQGSFSPANLEITAGSRFNCGEVNYIITEKIKDGQYQLECETAGTSGNLYSGFLLPIQYINGLQTAEISDLLIPGENADDTDSLRQRYYASLTGASFGGNIADYKEKINAIDGVGGVKIYPIWAGGGTVKAVILDSTYSKPSKALVSTVQTAVDPTQNLGEGLGIAPIGHVVTVEGCAETKINIQTHLSFKDSWDWEAIKPYALEAVDAYFQELAKAWADSANLIVRISQIETRLLGLTGVLDIGSTLLNGLAQNLTLAPNNIPVRETIANV